MFRTTRLAPGRYYALSFDTLEDRCVPALVVPALSSLPGAPAALYLDFDGHYQSSWGTYRNLSTQPFDTDGNPGNFSGTEQAAIREIWQRVAEDFAPFQLNVTTVDPGNFADRRALRIAVGMTNHLPAGIGGLGYIDAFTNSVPNVAYVLPQRLSNLPGPIATAVAHEAAHSFGLRHQSQYDSAGRKLDDYHPGNRLRAPIMGDGYSAQRSVWWSGPSDRSVSSIQDDMALLARAANGFGYRADDHGDTFRTATGLGFSGGTVRQSGLIGLTTDQDWFYFTTSGGWANLAVQVAAAGSNLDAVLEIYRFNGTTVQRHAQVAPGDNLGATLSTYLAAGTYYVVVRSQGAYGDVGTYTVTGTIPGGSAVGSPARPPAGRPFFSGASASSSSTAARAAHYDHQQGGMPHLDRSIVEALLVQKRTGNAGVKS